MLSSMVICSLFPGEAVKEGVAFPNMGCEEVEDTVPNPKTGLLEAPGDDPKGIGAVLEVENEDEEAPKVKPIDDGEEPKAPDEGC